MSLTRKITGILACTMLACVTGTAHAQLVNGGFETPGTSTIWEGWTNFDNCFADFTNFHGGFVSMKAYGNFSTDWNASGAYQQLPTAANQAWEAGVWVFNSSADPVQGNNLAALNIEWIDAFGAQMSYQTTTAANASTPVDTWQHVTLAGVAPAGAAYARITLVHVQAPGLLGGSVYFDDATLNPTTLTGLQNPSFEIPGTGGPNPFQGWVKFGNVFSDGTLVKTGSTAAKMFGNWSGPYNASGVFQELSANPGETWTGTAWVGTTTGDRVQGANFAVLNIEWHDQFGTLISFDSQHALDAATTPDVMHQVTVTGVAPPGTVSARIVPLHIQESSAGGAVWWDDITLAIAGPSCDTIDFNHDELFPDTADIDDFLSVFSGGACSNDPSCGDIDFNNDGLFPDTMDIDALLSVFSGGPCIL
ncbi:MAG: hypothetical protein U0637_12160 [Phycisphaerales bacterium]